MGKGEIIIKENKQKVGQPLQKPITTKNSVIKT
jgi:hypothetical protein